MYSPFICPSTLLSDKRSAGKWMDVTAAALGMSALAAWYHEYHDRGEHGDDIGRAAIPRGKRLHGRGESAPAGLLWGTNATGGRQLPDQSAAFPARVYPGPRPDQDGGGPGESGVGFA